MNPAVKKVLVIVAKNAVNAILTNAGLIAMLHGAFNFYSASGWWNIGKAALSVVIARESLVWVPVFLKWSMTNAQPDGNGTTPPKQ
jgi:hypothetical protein